MSVKRAEDELGGCVEAADGLAREAAADLSGRVDFGGAAFDLGASVWVHAHPGHGGDVECLVEAVVAAWMTCAA